MLHPPAIRYDLVAHLVGNACAPTADRSMITLFGVPAAFAAFLGLPTQL